MSRWSIEGYLVYDIYLGNYYYDSQSFTADVVTACTYRGGTLWAMSEELVKIAVL